MTEYPCHLPHTLLDGPPAAQALLQGNDAYPTLWVDVLFYPFQKGTLLLIRAVGLPWDGFFALHLHETGNCSTGGDIPFYCAGAHYNPQNTLHPNHAGDLPPILSNGGQAYAMCYTGRFSPQEALGHTVVLHERPDDFRSQPSGDSGGRIACGVVR